MDKEYLGAVIKGILVMPMLTGMMLWIAGRTDYWQAWLFGISNFVMVIVILALFRNRMDLARERMHPGSGVKWWDKILMPGFGVFMMAAFFIAVLDTGRYSWTKGFPAIGYVIGYAAYFGGVAFHVWAMYINKWFSSMVRIQKDRHQKVCMDGPYRFVRHPGYVGGGLMSLGISLSIGSLLGLIPAGISISLLVIRTYLEDKILQKELRGYKEYTKKVKYRLLPFVW